MKLRTVFAAVLASLLLSSCGGDGLVPLKYEDGLFVNGSRDLSYVPAEINYEPTEMGEAYAYYKHGNITLYAIGENDPALWLTENYAGGATTVFHDDSITLPTLAELNAEKIIVCLSADVNVAIMDITEADTIRAVTDLFAGGEECDWPLVDGTLRYDLKFYSSAWPQIYMNLIYGEFPEGKFLYERASGRCVEVGDLLDGYFHPDPAAGEAAS